MYNSQRREFLKKTIGIIGLSMFYQSAFAEVSNSGNTINVGYLPITDHLILPVSHYLDNKKYKNFSINPILCQSWDDMLLKFDMGILQAAFMLSPLAINKAQSGYPLKCILYGHTDGSVLAVQKSINSVKDLQNKIIGIPHEKSTHSVLLYKYLKDNNIDMKTYLKLDKVPPPLIVKHLKAGMINGYIVAEPWGMVGIDEDVVKILEYSKNIISGHVCCILVVKQNLIDEHLKELKEWVKSLQNAGRFIHANIDMAAKIQEPYMKHIPIEIAAIVQKKIISYTSLEPEKAKLKTIYDLAVESEILKKGFEIESFIDNRFAI